MHTRVFACVCIFLFILLSIFFPPIHFFVAIFLFLRNVLYEHVKVLAQRIADFALHAKVLAFV